MASFIARSLVISVAWFSVGGTQNPAIPHICSFFFGRSIVDYQDSSSVCGADSTSSSSRPSRYEHAAGDIFEATPDRRRRILRGLDGAGIFRVISVASYFDVSRSHSTDNSIAAPLRETRTFVRCRASQYEASALIVATQMSPSSRNR